MYDLEDGDEFYFIEYKNEYVYTEDIEKFWYNDDKFDDFLCKLCDKHLSDKFLYYPTKHETDGDRQFYLKITINEISYDSYEGLTFSFDVEPDDEKDPKDLYGFNKLNINYSFYFPRVSKGDGTSCSDNYAEYSFKKAAFGDGYHDYNYKKYKNDEPLDKIIPCIEDLLDELNKKVGIKHIM